MASVIASPGQEFPKKLPALPLIEHPALRKSEDNTADLQIRGSSREEGKAVLEELDDALPPLNRRIKQKALRGHSRVLTWPLGKYLERTKISIERPNYKSVSSECKSRRSLYAG